MKYLKTVQVKRRTISGRRRFDRRDIDKEDLINDLDDATRADPLLNSHTEFRSNWALSMEAELAAAANRETVNTKPIATRTGKEKELENCDAVKIDPVKQPRRRKKVALKDWFGKTSSDLSDSSASSQGEDEEGTWNSVERKKKNLRKKQARRTKLKDKTEELSTKMQYIIGLGPIEEASIDYFEAVTKN